MNALGLQGASLKISLAASLLDMDFKSSVRACMGGVLLAGCIMGALSVLGVSAFGAVAA